MTKARTSRVALAALLMLPVLATAGCAATAGAAPAPTSTVTSEPASTATPASEAGPAKPVWPDDRCRDEQLAAELTVQPGLSETGREGFTIVLTNVSEQSCSYYGWPGVLLLGADGTLLTSKDDKPLGDRDPDPGALAPNESAQAEGLLTAVGEYDCTPTTATTVRVLVTSDGAGPGIDAPADLQVCGDAWSDMSIGPLAPVS